MSNTPHYNFFYVARQPIFDRERRTYGYELLFRGGSLDTEARVDDADLATINVATCGFIAAQENVDQTRRIFINFTENLILSGAPRALPPAVTVIELLEDIVPSSNVMTEVVKLKQEGYLVALDDYIGEHRHDALLDIVDIIKVDVLGKSESQVAAILDTMRQSKALKLAEKVEARKSYKLYRKMGFDLFQGYFFAKPENLTGKKLQSYLGTKFEMLAALNEPDPEIGKIVEVVARDPSITYRLLRLMNSAAFGFSMKIDSIQHAVMLLGSRRIRYWLRMVVLSDINAANNPSELLLLALSRGKLLEELAMESHILTIKPETAFLFGLLSLLDVMLDMPFAIIFEKLPLPESFQEGYLDQESLLGPYLQLLLALENDNQPQLVSICNGLNVPPARVIEASIRANAWTDSMGMALH